jgi:hypothetical protein
MSNLTPDIFAYVPIEVIKDKRLTFEQTRVLIGLFSFRNKSTNVCWPSRSALSERTGLHVSNISAATSALEKLGWLTKEGKGGYSKSSTYTITTPDLDIVQHKTVVEKATVAESTTVAEQATRHVAESAISTLAESATRKEQTIELTKEQTIIKAKKLEFVLPDWIPVDVWDAYVGMRKQMKKPMSDYAKKLAVNELLKLVNQGFNPADVLNQSILNSWQGLFPIKGQVSKAAIYDMSTKQGQRNNFINQLYANQSNNGEVFDGTVING